MEQANAKWLPYNTDAVVEGEARRPVVSIYFRQCLFYYVRLSRNLKEIDHGPPSHPFTFSHHRKSEN
jgi:hypothetical protein